MNVREVTQAIIRATEVRPFPAGKTCDVLIAGNPEKEVRRVGSTFMATVDVIRRAIEEKVDLIITHEPTWFTGVDNLDWVEGDPVYEAKKKLLDSILSRDNEKKDTPLVRLTELFPQGYSTIARMPAINLDL